MHLFRLSYALILVCAAATGGCLSKGGRELVDEDKAEAAAYAAKAREAGEKAMDDILTGLEKSDYSLFSKSFTIEMREAFPEKDKRGGNGFEAFVNNNYRKFGDGYESRLYLGQLNVGELTALLWKARFKGFRNDVLLRLDIGEVDGTFKVFRFLIQ